ncbi:MAG: lysine--tRNA ligase [Candidatus Gracilibacteria bacterium]
MSFWVDEIAEQIAQAFPDKKEILIRDEKTASGRVHVGSLRGVVLHGVLAEALNQMGRKATFFYEINDADPMDGLPVYLDQDAYRPYMGKPLKDVPAPDELGRPTGEATPEHNFAQTWGDEFIGVIHNLGFNEKNYTKLVSASEIYKSGRYNEWIEKVCAHPDKIREIYKRISGSEKAEEWFPLQIVCEKCGKVGCTTVVGFDGKEATYRCEKDKVKWAQGCGYEGKVAPWDGRGKLPWKVEWAVKWASMPVDVEAAGKDHNAAGGSHDVAEAICQEVLGAKVPFNVPYEFILFGGAKMSASKGLGATAKAVSAMIPPELLRFLMVRSRPNQPIDFNMDGDTIARLYDNHDECAEIYFGGKEGNSDLGRAFHFAQLDSKKVEKRFLPRFSRLAFIVQIPHLDVMKEVEQLKGNPLHEADREEALERSEYAKMWLKEFAGDSARFEIQQAMPDLAHDLSEDQKQFLKEIVAVLRGNAVLKGEALHTAIHELRKASTLEARDAFGAIYKTLLGKESGPQAGWFLEALDRSFVIQRFENAAALPPRVKVEVMDLKTQYIILTKEVRERFPEIKVGCGILKGVKIAKNHPDLEKLREELWKGLDFKTLKNKSPKLQAFNDIYRGFGVKPSNNKPAPVALMSRLAAGKVLPNINVAVDIANMISVKYQLATALLNVDQCTLPLSLDFAKGGEKFQGIGDERSAPIMPGELCWFDATDYTVTRDWNYRDCEKTKVTEKTVNLFLDVDGNDASSMEEVEACLVELETLLKKYCGGTMSERVIVEAKVNS